MSRNGPVALVYHTLFVIFMLAPIVVVCWVAFTPEGFLSFPTTDWSLRWFRAIARYPEFIYDSANSVAVILIRWLKYPGGSAFDRSGNGCLEIIFHAHLQGAVHPLHDGPEGCSLGVHDRIGGNAKHGIAHAEFMRLAGGQMC